MSINHELWHLIWLNRFSDAVEALFALKKQEKKILIKYRKN